ncbi:MAG: dienelactone hydrolase family protein [Acidimicrobiia bacterium]
MAALAEGPFEVEVERITLRGEGGEPVEAIHARPLGLPSRGLVVHPDIMGIRPLFDDLCRRLATHGLAVCAPEPFPHLGDRDALDPMARMDRVKDLEDSVQIGNLERAADWLVVHDDVSEVAILGFCMGGMYALRAAATGRFDRAIAVYGMIRVPEGWRGPDLQEPLAVAGEACPTLAVFGSEDQWTPPEDIQALRDAWSGRPDCEVVVYEGADHGFVHDADRPAHRAADAGDAWSRVLALLGVEEPAEDSSTAGSGLV